MQIKSPGVARDQKVQDFAALKVLGPIIVPNYVKGQNEQRFRGLKSVYED